MKTNISKGLLLIANLFIANYSFGAIFTVYNNSNKPITAFIVSFDNPIFSKDLIGPNNSKQYNTWNDGVLAFQWADEKNCMFKKNVPVRAINIGGNFNIEDSDGGYSYYFGVDGKGNGKVSPVCPTKK